VVTNCSLLALQQGTAGPDQLLSWVGLEHLLLVLFLAVDQLISDVPAHVKLATDRTDFFFKHQAVKVKQD
jgi:hypothetical protein